MEQTITSAKTCVAQVPALHKKICWKPGIRNLDYGGGRYINATLHLADRGCDNLVFDPYNQTLAHNQRVLDDVFHFPPDTATLANVLNVIREHDVRIQILKNLKAMVKTWNQETATGLIFISCYEGDGTGVGKITSKGWQENRRQIDYFSEIREVFYGVSFYNGYFSIFNNR